MVAYIIKIEDLPTFSDIKTDKLIGFCVVDLLRNHLQMFNLNHFCLIFSILKIVNLPNTLPQEAFRITVENYKNFSLPTKKIRKPSKCQNSIG